MSDYPNKHNRQKDHGSLPCPDIDMKKITDYNYLVTRAEEFGKMLAKLVKRSQFRRVFTHIKKIQTDVESKNLQKTAKIPEDIMKKILLLKPRMAYTAGRKKELKDFYRDVVKFVDRMEFVSDFNRFYDYVEAVLAYHRYHGGTD